MVCLVATVTYAGMGYIRHKLRIYNLKMNQSVSFQEIYNSVALNNMTSCYKLFDNVVYE